ncbi:uncharacterized protein [Acropora muricata]|uniref:uncharacterized protein n=1 Tax=Acropora muricata TaxID=159855 RepID=UPI0034E4B907
MAAPAANSELLEDVCKVLEKLEEEIVKVDELCMLRRRETECCIEHCRNLLKPWPLKSMRSEETTGNNENSSMKQQSESENVENIEIAREAEKTERQDLAALDCLLAKAQRIRETQTKIDEVAATASVKMVSSSKKPLPVSMAPVKAPSGQTEKDSLSTKPNKSAPKKASAARKSLSQRPVVKSTYNSSYGRAPSAKSLVRPSVSKGAAKVYLGSVIQRNSEGKQSINDSKKEGSFRDSSKRKATTSGAGTSEYLDVHASNMKSTDPGLPKVNEPSNSSNNTQPSALTVMDEKQGNVIGKSPESVSGQVKRESRSNSRRTNMQADKQETFDPFTEGSELKLPVKYRKLKAASAKLYSELEKIADNRETSLACQQFLHDVESVFDMGNIPTYSELQGRATELLEEHEKLSALVNNVVHRSHTIGDDSPWPEVYKCYRHWQIVLSKFHELQKKTQQLLKAEEQLSKACPCGKCSSFDCENPPQNDVSSQSRDKRQEGCVLLSSWLTEEIKAVTSFQVLKRPPGITEFTYSSPKELSELVRLQHEAQLLCLQLHMKELAGQKLLPILEKLEPTDSSFVPLFRMIHGFLCGDNKVFPAMVHDNIC